MRTKVISCVIFVLMLSAALIVISPSNVSAGTIIVPDNYLTIQQAINAAKSGDTIYVRAGTYNEHLTINKAITLMGESRDTTIIDGNENGKVVRVESDWVNITGFTVIRSGLGPSDSGIVIYGRQNCTIHNNTFMNNTYGIYLTSSINNNIADNNMIGDGIFVLGWLVEHWNTHNIDISNVVNDKPIYYYKNQKGGTVPFGAGQVILANCSDMQIEDQNLNYSSVGIELGFSTNISIVNNAILYNYPTGIRIVYSERNLFQNNIIVSNGWVGIYATECDNNKFINNKMISNGEDGWELHRCLNNIFIENYISNHRFGISSVETKWNMFINNTFVDNEFSMFIRQNSIFNEIYHNNFINNAYTFDESVTGNKWDNGYPSGGNYWSDYGGVDNFTGPNQDIPGSDGIGDTPYIMMSNSKDNYPLMNPRFRNITTVIDINPDTLNLKSKGRWITCYITLNEPYDVADIDISTILLEDTIPAEWGDIQGDTLMVKFDRSEVEDMLPVGTYNLKVTGELTDGTVFEGYSDEIRVIDPGK